MTERSSSGFKPPFLRPDQIEDAACELLRSAARTLGSELQPPVPVEAILENHLKVTIEFKNMEKLLGQPNVLGAAWIDEGIVRLDDKLVHTPGRLEFTVAHEIGHWQLHRPLVIVNREHPTLPGLGTTSNAPSIVCRSNAQKEPMEWQADQFAAHLLMPTRHLRAAASRLFPRGLKLPDGLEQAERFEEQKQWFDGIAGVLVRDGGFTNCSRQAMRIRIQELKLVDVSGERPFA